MAGQSLARRHESMRKNFAAKAQAAERRIIIGGTGAALGWLEGRGHLPVSIGNIPIKLAIGLGAMLVEANTSGATRRLSGALSDTALAVYGFEAAKTGNVIAGEDDVSGEL